MAERKVNLFVVGAMKAGTTSFMELLSSHPKIYTSPIKEPHYFIDVLPKDLYEPSRFFSLDDYFSKVFPKPLHIANIKRETHYKKLFSLAGQEKYLSEGSTAYLHAEESASKIHKYHSDARIIILIRNPLERAFSHYRMDLGLGREKKSFDKVLQWEISQYKKRLLSWNSYLGMSFYDNSIERFENMFTNVCIIDYEQFIKDKTFVLQKVSKFLEIDSFNENIATHENETKTVRFQKVLFFLKKIGLKDYFSRIFNNTFRQWLFKKISKENKQVLTISDKTKQEVTKIFQKESQKW